MGREFEPHPRSHIIPGQGPIHSGSFAGYPSSEKISEKDKTPSQLLTAGAGDAEGDRGLQGQQRDVVLQAVPQQGPRDPGKWQQATRRGFATAAEAAEARRAFAAEIQAQADKPTRTRPTLTVAELVEQYHTDAEAMGELTERTLYDQRGYLRNNIAPHIGTISANALTPAQTRAWLVTLGTEGGRHGQGLSANTIRLNRSLLLKAYSYGLDADLVDTNPVERTDPPKNRKKIPEHWTPDQARQFLAYHEADRLYPLWAFMLSTWSPTV